MNPLARAPLFVCIALSCAAIAGAGLCWIPGGTPACTAPGYQLQSKLVSDGAGGAFIVWADLRPSGADLDIYAQRLDARGNPLWTPDGIPVCAASRRQYNAIIGADGFGGAIVAWMDQRLGGADIFAQRISGAGEMLWGTDGSIVNVLPDFQIDPQPVMVPDEVGGAIFTWVDEVLDSDGEMFPKRKTDIYAQRLAGNGGYMMWHPYGLPLCLARGFQTDPVIMTDGAGGAIVGWIDDRRLAFTDIYAQRVTPEGDRLWLDNGAPICQTYTDQRGLSAVSDGSGGAIFIWYDHSQGTYDIYASRVNGDAEPLWAVNGIPVAVLPGQQMFPVICSDGAGGCIAAWTDDRNGSLDIYAQRVDGHGNLRWPASGIPICIFVFDQTNVNIVSDGEGGAIVSWIDPADDYPSICAQRVNAAGAVLWRTGGVVVCGSISGKYSLGIASDGGSGGAIVAFIDDRAIETDVYAQRVHGNGTIVATCLKGFDAVLDGSAVRVTWTLAEAGEDAAFRVMRAGAEDEPADALLEGAVERAGLSFSFVDRTVEPGHTYRYRVDVSEGGSSSTLFETKPVVVPAAALALHQNHPNPFNPSTTIGFSLSAAGRVTLDVYDVSGARVRALAAGAYAAGAHSISWDGRNDRGESAPSGIYFCRLRAGKETLSRTMVLMR